MKINEYIANKPEEIPVLFAAAWNNRSAEALASLFFEDADFVNVVGLWWHNKKDIRKAHDYGLKVIFNKSILKLLKTKVKLITEEVAVVHARMKLSGQSEHEMEQQTETRYNIFTFMVKKTQSGWKCVAAQNTDIVPGAETNIVVNGQIKAVDYRQKG
ncbi:SgcJ/EcaC family oxidoreductase [soil metagenome]